MAQWPLKRMWEEVDAEGDRRSYSTLDLGEFPACVLLGTAGLGKTTELKSLCDSEKSLGKNVRFVRLVELGATADGLQQGLEGLLTDIAPPVALYLDALDEVLVPVRTATAIVARWIGALDISHYPFIRISCRSSVWADAVKDALLEKYEEDYFIQVALQPLSDSDVETACTAEALDSTAFRKAVNSIGAGPLARQPLTLRLLLNLFKEKEKALPDNRAELFKRAIHTLVKQPRERHDLGTSLQLIEPEVIKGAETIACLTLFSGKESIDLNDSPSEGSIGEVELQNVAADLFGTDAATLRKLAQYPLFDRETSGSFRFQHRQIAEYLAGRRLSELPFHQARSLLASGLGWQSGVAGPLREIAAFAAMLSDAIAQWVTEYDPEVVGASDIDNNQLRARATQNLIALFRSGRYTYVQLDALQLDGLRHDGADAILRPLLLASSTEPPDVVELVLALIRDWPLREMSDDLATMMLDAATPHALRVSAGYVLLKMGTTEAQKRLLPLIHSQEDDPEFSLKGLALRANWPVHLTVDELFAALTPPLEDMRHGAYDGFFFHLDQEGFDAADNRLAGLVWARQFVTRDNSYDSGARIATRIAIAAVDELDREGVLPALVDLMVAAANAHKSSPLIPPRSYSAKTSEVEIPVTAARPKARRMLLEEIASRAPLETYLAVELVRKSHLLESDDFVWILEHATNPAFPFEVQRCYAFFLRLINWYDNQPRVDAWLAVRDHPAVAAELKLDMWVELDSEQAKYQRDCWEADQEHKLRPPKEQEAADTTGLLEKALHVCETESPHGFYEVCALLTFEPVDEEHGSHKRLSEAGGWSLAPSEIRPRVIAAAKGFLDADTKSIELARTSHLNNIHGTAMVAMRLILQSEPQWLELKDVAWWEQWTWYILRELRPGLEPPDQQGPVRDLLAMLLAKSPKSALSEFQRLCEDEEDAATHLLESLLELAAPIPCPDLDEQLLAYLGHDTPAFRKALAIGEFLSEREPEKVEALLAAMVQPKSMEKHSDAVAGLTLACLRHRPSASWPLIDSIFHKHPAIQARVLLRYASMQEIRAVVRGGKGAELDFTNAQRAQLAMHIFREFPPESDLQDQKRAHSVTDRHAVAHLRDRVVSWLGDQREASAVEALRFLEATLGSKYSWLRYPRSRAERNYLLSKWSPIPVEQMADILRARNTRLIRSGVDALEACVAAIEVFQEQIRTNQIPMATLWDFPKRGKRTPKDETTLSNVLAASLRQYFREYAVAASREELVHSRLDPASAGGPPSSELDIGITIPAAGSATGEAIRVPVEIKLSHNPEAKTGLEEQLFKRYMTQWSTPLGVYVVVWTGVKQTKKGSWSSPSGAKKYLEDQAQRVAPPPIDVRVVMVDIAPSITIPVAQAKRSRSNRARAKRGRETAKKARPVGYRAKKTLKGATKASAQKAKRKGVAKVRKRRRKS